MKPLRMSSFKKVGFAGFPLKALIRETLEPPYLRAEAKSHMNQQMVKEKGPCSKGSKGLFTNTNNRMRLFVNVSLHLGTR
jgi:hypothetical protein